MQSGDDFLTSFPGLIRGDLYADEKIQWKFIWLRNTQNAGKHETDFSLRLKIMEIMEITEILIPYHSGSFFESDTSRSKFSALPLQSGKTPLRNGSCSCVSTIRS